MTFYKEKSGIYSITNKINNKRYIGLSKNLNSRLNLHEKTLRENRHINIILQRAINKYGIDNFIFEIIEEVDEKNLSSREIFWINYYDSVKNGYNILLGGKDEYRKKTYLVRNGFPSMHFIKNIYLYIDAKVDFYCQIVFKIHLEDFILKKDKNYEERKVFKKYLKIKEISTDLVLGNFEKYKDKRKIKSIRNMVNEMMDDIRR